MKKIIFVFAITTLLSCQTKQSGWVEVWSEDFNSSTLDTAIWSKIPRGSSDWNNYMSDFDSLYELRNGSLVLKGIANKTQHGDTATYLTGGIWTKDKKNFENGLLEIRAKLESSIGAWPAFWMLANNRKWPEGGEIDIMEHLNHDSVVYQTIHSVYTLEHKIKDNPVSGTIVKIDPNGWNTYGIELSKDSLCFYVNSKKTMTYPRIETNLSGQYPFIHPMYLLLDMQLGGSWVGGVDPKELPVEMEIDYVKFFQKK